MKKKYSVVFFVFDDQFLKLKGMKKTESELNEALRGSKSACSKFKRIDL